MKKTITLFCSFIIIQTNICSSTSPVLSGRIGFRRFDTPKTPSQRLSEYFNGDKVFEKIITYQKEALNYLTSDKKSIQDAEKMLLKEENDLSKCADRSSIKRSELEERVTDIKQKALAVRNAYYEYNAASVFLSNQAQRAKEGAALSFSLLRSHDDIPTDLLDTVQKEINDAADAVIKTCTLPREQLPVPPYYEVIVPTNIKIKEINTQQAPQQTGHHNKKKPSKKK